MQLDDDGHKLLLHPRHHFATCEMAVSEKKSLRHHYIIVVHLFCSQVAAAG